MAAVDKPEKYVHVPGAPKDDLLVESNHADFSLYHEASFALFWLDTPKKGKCLCVEYNAPDYPSLTVHIQANWKAKRVVEQYRRHGWIEEIF